MEAGPKDLSLRADVGSPSRRAGNEHFDKGIVHFLVCETRLLRFRDLEAWSWVGLGKVGKLGREKGLNAIFTDKDFV